MCLVESRERLSWVNRPRSLTVLARAEMCWTSAKQYLAGRKKRVPIDVNVLLVVSQKKKTVSLVLAVILSCQKSVKINISVFFCSTSRCQSIRIIFTKAWNSFFFVTSLPEFTHSLEVSHSNSLEFRLSRAVCRVDSLHKFTHSLPYTIYA